MHGRKNPSSLRRLPAALAGTVALALAFGSGASADDPVPPGPTETTPQVRIANYSPFVQKLDSDRVVNVANVRCVVGTCSINSATKARVLVRGRTFGPVTLNYPTATFEAGSTVEVSVVLPEAAVERLGGPRRVGRVLLRVKASATVGELTTTRERTVSRGFRIGKVPNGPKWGEDRPGNPNS